MCQGTYNASNTIMILLHPSLSLYLFLLINSKNDQTGADEGVESAINWEKLLYGHNKIIKSVINEYKYQENDSSNNWVLDEEHIFTPYSKTGRRSTLESIENELWWMVTSQDDPAMDAEPAFWDGLANNMSSNLFLDYEVIQNKWEEDAVT